MSAGAATGAGSVAASTATAVAQAANAATLNPTDGLQRVSVPVTPASRPQEPAKKLPKKTPKPMQPPRNMEGGKSPLSTGSIADGRSSVDAIMGEEARSHAEASLDRLPHRNGLVAFAVIPAEQIQGISGKGGQAMIYLEDDR